VYVDKICEEEFGGCMLFFHSKLGQKVKDRPGPILRRGTWRKKIDVHLYNSLI